MEELLQLMQDLHPEIDFEVEKALMDDDLIDSFDMISLVADISDIFGVVIHGQEINPENFNSIEGIWALIQAKQEE